jgi:diguanylate cyclase (GGDEF)-like protein
MVFRLWLAVNLIFLVAAFAGTSVYVWSSVEDEIEQSRNEVSIREQTMRTFSTMALRVLQLEGTYNFTEEDFEMLRNVGVYRMDLFDDSGAAILRIDPHNEEVTLSPGYLSYIRTIPAGSARLNEGEPLQLPPRTRIVPRIDAVQPSAEQIAAVHTAGLTSSTVKLDNSSGELVATPAVMTPWQVLRGTSFGEELWLSRPGQVQQSFFAIPDLDEAARSLIVNASLVMAAVFIATSAGCWLLLRRMVYRPLRRFSIVAGLIADGQPLRIPITASGEMGGLARAVNDMADALESRATIDSLTGLYNHRHLTAEMERLISVSQHTSEPLSVLVADLNDFKQINDTFGHNAGDVVLCDIASILLEWADGKFICWRLGGDEFAAAMPNMPKSRARLEAMRLQRMIESRTFSFSGGAARTTVSVGLASSPADGATATDLLNVADGHMYMRKDISRETRLA